MKIETVGGAFNYFIREKVNLAKSRTDKARSSRDSIIDKINNLSYFLPLDKSKHLHFGSFARRTKIRPIDDIDIMICLSVTGNWSYSGNSIEIKVTDVSNTYLKECCDTYASGWHSTEYKLNSTKVKNKFKSALSNLHDCRKAELHSNKEAVTLQFTSYEWTFDIVPCVYVDDSQGGYYLIPDGNGKWKKTDPRKDRDKVSHENTRLSGRVLELIRMAKYWARVNLSSEISSYLIETMVVKYCADQSDLSECSDWKFEKLLEYFQRAPYYQFYDMKGIQGDINKLSSDQKYKFSRTAMCDYNNALKAHDAEMSEKNQSKALSYWKEVFGTEFPSYGEDK